MKISKEKLSEYARLIVRTGANVQPGQVVQLSIAVEQHEFAAMITDHGGSLSRRSEKSQSELAFR